MLGAGVALLVFVIFSQAAFNLKFLRPESLVQTSVFVALSALIFLALVALIFVLLRTLLKLYLERQAGTAGRTSAARWCWARWFSPSGR